MQKSIELAKNSGVDIPVGAVVVKNGKILAARHNEREVRKEVSAHAEILVLNDAAKKLDNRRLGECDLYVTLEPCPMCAWAILNSGVKNVYFGAYDTNYGAFGGALNLSLYGNFKTKIFGGIMEEECGKLIKDYFKSIRK